MAADHPPGRRAGPAAQEGRQRPDGRRRRPGDPPGQRPGRRLLPDADRRRARVRCAAGSSGRSRTRSRRCRLVAGFDFPDMEQPYEYLSLRRRTAATRSRPAASSRPRAGRSPCATSASTSRSSTSSTPTPCTPASTGAGTVRRRTAGPVHPELRPALRRRPGGRHGGRARADLPQPVPVHRRARRRAGRGPQRGAADHRRLERRSRPERPRPASGWGGLRCQRGAARHPLPPLRPRRRRDHPDAQIVPPTSQNQRSVEADLRTLVETWSGLDDHALQHRCEQAIRNYDPCISCATHFLDLTVDRA